jgi:YidC/Oxa1 family membrane protein insertase
VWQSLLNALGQALSFFYDFGRSYGVAIILLTVAVRVVLLPLTIKQVRSMQEMGKLQPELKALQKKYKGNRQKLQEETMKLYKEHQVNPLGGCLPLLLQLPVFFALFSVLRAVIPMTALPAEPIAFERIEEAAAETVFCRPVGEPSAEGTAENAIECDFDGDRTYEETFAVEEWVDRDGRRLEEAPAFLTRCLAQDVDGEVEFACESPVGSGNLPRDGALFEDIVEDRATFLGMHLSCGATQAQSDENIRFCAPPATRAGGAPLVGYYGLIAFMVVSTWYQTKQMQRSAAQQQPGMQMMARVMPVFLGFISLTIPAGVLVYWVTTNGWQVGQQYVMLRQRAKAQERGPVKGLGAGKAETPEKETGDEKETGKKPQQERRSGDQGRGQGQPQPKKPSGGKKRSGGRGGRGRKKRRKR